MNGEILFLAHRMPFPPDRGDKIRSHHLLGALAKIAPVHVGCFGDSDADFAAEPELAALAASHCLLRRSKSLVRAGLEALASGRPVSCTAFDHPDLHRWVAATLRSRPISTVVVFSGQMGQYVPDDFAGRVVIDLCDVDSAKFEDYAEAGERAWLNRREARLLAREEERLAHRAHATVLISASEKALFESRLIRRPRGAVHAIGNGIDADRFDPSIVVPEHGMASRPGPHLVFTGQMDYRPNELAALWAIETLLPKLRARFPDAELHIVGRNPGEQLLLCADTPGVTVTGEVADVRPYLAAADCVVAPLTIARGIQNKVLEAMAMARPVLLTGEAATGIAAVDGEHWMVAPADAEAMTERFSALWGDWSARLAMGQAARRFVLDNHAWDVVLAPFAALVEAETEARHAA